MPRINKILTELGLEELPHNYSLHLARLTAEWQVLADLAMADLILWLPVGKNKSGDSIFTAVAQCRPATGATIHFEDVLGLNAAPARSRHLAAALERREIVKADQLRWAGSYSVAETYVPIPCDGDFFAVLSCELNSATIHGQLGSLAWFGDAATRLFEMIPRGEFPYADIPTHGTRGAPRVVDGVVELDAEGVVCNASPNAYSCFRRLGISENLTGQVLTELVTEVIAEHANLDETMPVVVMGRAAWQTELESRQATIAVRALPLVEYGARRGAILLCRDVSDQRRREMQILTKDATIREIHHRVKNNLQTVSALLRMQARRSNEEKVSHELETAQRRVATIAKVHEVLSANVDERVDFDQLVTPVLRMAAQTAAAEGEATTDVTGQFGTLNADCASALAVVLAELVANAVEHGLKGGPGTVSVQAQRQGGELTVTVRDDGVGIAEGRALAGLGTQIVRTMVRSQLHGTIDWHPAAGGGTEAVVHIKEVD